MVLTIRNHLRKMRKHEKGMFTLEASLIFPIVFVVTIALILFSLVVYQKVVIYQKAHLIAERASFTWDNSKKDFDTGAFGMNEYSTDEGGDGLYWRTNFIGKQLIKKVLNIDVFNDLTGVKIEKANSNGSAMYPSGTVDVDDPEISGFDSQITVTASSELRLPDFVNLVSDDSFHTSVTASIKEPVELIRTTDFIVHYAKEIMGYISGGD